MKHIITCSILILTICSCGRTSDNFLTVIELDHFASKPKEIYIEEFVSHIDYIQLETSPESLIGIIEKIQIKNNKIFILDEVTESLLVFDISGKFIRRIGTKGRGPGEYIAIHDFALCDSVVLMLDYGQSKVLLYDSLGRWMTDKRIPNIDRIAFLKGMPALGYNYPKFAFNNGFRISIIDRNMNPVADLLKSEINLDEISAIQYGMSHFRSFFSNVNDTLTLWECRDDVIYKIFDENTIKKRYYIKYKNPAKFEDGMNRLEPGSNEISRMREAPNHIFFLGSYDGAFCRLIYFKETGKGISIAGKTKNSAGPDFFPEEVTEDGNALQSFSVFTYKTELERNNTALDTLDPKLQSLLKTCRFDDNPCIMLVTLK